MDYKEKYDKAFERAREWYNDPNINIGLKGNLENIFPELKEREDGKIRNAIKYGLDHVFTNNTTIYDTTKEQCLAWLEKQGEQGFSMLWHDANEEPEELREIFCEWETNDATWHDVVFYHADTKTFWDGELRIDNVVKWSYIDEILEKGKQKEYTFKSLPRLLDMIEPTSKAKEYCQKLIDTLEKEGYSSDAKIVGDRLKKMNGEEVPMATMDEIQVVNSNKIVQKFKVGDWVIENGKGRKPQQITRFEDRDDGTLVWFNNGTGTYTDFLIGYHLWTIKDAEDGDILAEDDRPFIFKGLIDPNHPCEPVAYCGIDWGNNFIAGSGLNGGTNRWCSCKRVKPTTKKQHDFLFEKIKDAGFEWDSDKKKLNQIR